MDCHERTTAALSLQCPDRVPVFSCTDKQNQVYEILGRQGEAVPLHLFQRGITGALFGLAAPVVNASGWLNRQIESFVGAKIESDIAVGYDCTWAMYSAVLLARDNHRVADIYGRLYDLVADPDGNLDTPMYREGLLTTPAKWDEWPHPEPDQLYTKLKEYFGQLQRRFGEQIYLMGNLLFGLWENVSQAMGLPALAVALRRDPEFVRRAVEHHERLQLAAVHAIADAGMPGMLYADDLGHKSGPQTAPAVLSEFFGPSLRRITNAAHERGLKIVIHSCGNVNQLLELFVDWGFDGVHALEPTAGMDLGNVKRRVGDRMCIFGNLDISHIMSHGTHREVELAVKKALGAAAMDGGFIMAMTNSHNGVRVENTRWMIEFTRRYGTYPLKLDRA